MASLEELGQALKLAHDAGDADNALVLAKAYNHQRAVEQVANDPISRNLDANAEMHNVLKNTAGSWGQGNYPYQWGGAATDWLAQHGAPPWAAAAGGTAVRMLPEIAQAAIGSGSLVKAVPSGQVTSVFQPQARWLMKSAVKPAGITDAASQAKATSALDSMLARNISPNVEDIAKANMQARAMDATVKNILDKVPNIGVSVSKTTQPAQDLARRYTMQVNPNADVSAVQNGIAEYLSSPAVAGRASIPATLAHQLKQGTYQQVGAKSYGEMGTAATEVQKQLARGLRNAVAEAVPETQAPLANQADLMNIIKTATKRAFVEGNKDPGGLALLRLDDPVSAMASIASRTAGFKAALAHALYRSGQPGAILSPVLSGNTYLRDLYQRNSNGEDQ